jgi:hypothetical protein
VRIKATEMVGVGLTTQEIRWLLDALAEGKIGPGEGPEMVALQRKLTVMLRVATAAENRSRHDSVGSTLPRAYPRRRPM